LDDVPFDSQFARSIAISPDNTLLAVSYGIAKGISGSAFFGIYSLADGHRLSTLKGDTFTPNLRQIFISDIYSAHEAPINAALQFSPDSKSLYTSSRNLRQWDVSILH
jgi:WD40 repeat protein